MADPVDNGMANGGQDPAPAGGAQGGRRCCENPRHGRGGGRGALAEPAVLAALLREGSHGYDLRRAIAEMTDGALNVDAGGLYRVLRRLEDEGIVRSTWADGETGPQRREYETAPGARDLAQDWVDHLRERQRVAGDLADILERTLSEQTG